MARPIYVPQAGRVIEFSSDASDDDIQAYVQRAFPAPQVEVPPVPTQERGLANAFTSGVYSGIGSLEAAAGKGAQGIESIFGTGSGTSDYLFQKADENSAEAAKYPAQDIMSGATYGDMAYNLLEGVAQSAPTTVAGLGAGLIGSVATPAVGFGAMASVFGAANFGANLQEQQQQNGTALKDTSAATALPAAAAQTVLDVFGAELMLKGVLPAGLTRTAVGKFLVDNAEKGVGKVATAAGGEAITESLQQAIQIGQANPDRLFEMSPEVQNELISAALIGGVSAGGMSIASSPFSKMQENKANAPGQQLDQDLKKESIEGAQQAQRAEVVRGIDALVAKKPSGTADITSLSILRDVNDPAGERDEVFRLSTGGKHLADFTSVSTAQTAVKEYNARTNGNLSISNGKADSAAGETAPAAPEAAQPAKISNPEGFAETTPAKVAKVTPRPKLTPIPYDTLTYDEATKQTVSSSGVSDIVDYGDRKMVTVDVNGKKVPFYLSTGSGGKAGVASGKWYPFFGIGSDGWINKTNSADINGYYGSPELRDIAQQLDSSIGDVRKDKSIPKTKMTGAHIAHINDGLEPSDNHSLDTLHKVRRSIDRITERARGYKQADASAIAAQAAPSLADPLADPVADPVAPVTPVVPEAPAGPEVTPEVKAKMAARDRAINDGVNQRLKSLVPGKDFVVRTESTITDPAAPDPMRDQRTARGVATFEKDADGRRVVITLATDIYNPNLTVEQNVKTVVDYFNHEIVHGLYTAGLLSQREIAILTRAARTSMRPGRKYTYYDRANETYRGVYGKTMQGQELEQAIEEEAIAEMFREWVASPKETPVQARPFLNRMLQFFKRLFAGLKSAQHLDVFKRIESGEVGARARDWSDASGNRFNLAPEDKAPSATLDENGFAVRPLPEAATNSSSVYLRDGSAPFSKRLNIVELGKAFDAAFLQRFGRSYDITNPDDYTAMLDSISEEVEHQKQQATSGVGWYDADIQDVFKELSKAFPILKDPGEGPVYQRMYTLIAGVMSNGMKAKANVELASVNFAHFLKNGQFSSDHPFSGKGWNQRSNIMGPQITMLNSMIRDPRFAPRPGSNNPNLERYEKFIEYMFSAHSVREINSFRQKHGTKSPAKIGLLGDNRLGVYAFGPKFGPFILNLNGYTDETVDSWASRSFYRHMGKSINANGKMQDAPAGPAHREAMKRMLRDIATKTNLSSRDVQAVLWFYEKELYNHLGQRIPLEVFSDGARNFSETYASPQRLEQSGTDRERDIARSVSEASVGYGETPQRIDGKRSPRFSIAPSATPQDTTTAAANPLGSDGRKALIERRKTLMAELRPLAEKQTLTGAEAKRYMDLAHELGSVLYDLSVDKPLDPSKIKGEAERMSVLPTDIVVQAYQDALKNRDVYMAISNAAFGTQNDALTDVDRLNPKLLHDTFADTRAALRAAFGDTMHLYRAEGMQREKPTKNWATTREYAAQFGRNIIEKDIPVDDILAVNVGSNGNYHEMIVGQGTKRSPRFSIAPSATPQERVDAFKDSQWMRYFGGRRAEGVLSMQSDPDNEYTFVAMSPDEYLKLATYGLRNPGQEKVYAENMDRGMVLAEFPMFELSTDDSGQTVVSGHEGRHRAAAFREMGFTKIPVMLHLSTYKWGLQQGIKPSQTLIGQSPVSYETQLPESIFFPTTEKGTQDLNELLAQGAPVSNVSVGLAPEESSLGPQAVAAMAANPPSVYGNKKMPKKDVKEYTSVYIPQGIALTAQPIETAARNAGAIRVYNTSGLGMYGNTFVEPTSTLEAVVSDEKRYAVANAMAEQTFEIAKNHNQLDAFVAVKVTKDEWTEPYARPGITIHFFPQGGGATARTSDEVKAIIKSLPGAEAIGGYMAIASKKATSSRGGLDVGYEAIRFIWVPEYAGVQPGEVINNYRSTLTAMNEIAKFAERSRIGSSAIDYYDLSLASKDTYDQRIQEHRELRASSGAETSGGNGPWHRSIGESVSERAGKKADWVAGSHLDVGGARKRFSLSPNRPEVASTPYVEQQNTALFAQPVAAKPLTQRFSEYFFGNGYNPGSFPDALRVHLTDVDARVLTKEREANRDNKISGAKGEYERLNARYSSYVALQMAERSSHVASYVLRHGAPTINMVNGDINSAYLDVGNDPDSIKGVIQLLADGPINAAGEKQSLMNVFRDYAIALRGHRLEQDGFEVPNDPRWTREALQEGAKYQNVLDAHAMYQRFNKKMMQAALDSGTITQEAFASYTDKMDYYGFYRTFGEDTQAQKGTVKTAGNIKIMKYQGSEAGDLMKDPIMVMTHNANFWVGTIMRNIAAQKSLNLLETLGEARELQTGHEPDTSRGEEDETLYVRKDGISKRYAVKDYLLLKSLGADDGLNIPKLFHMMGIPSKMLRESVTRDPRFMVANMVRDTLSAWILRGESVAPVIGTLRGWKDALKGSASHDRLGSFGVVGSYDEATRSSGDIADALKRDTMGEKILNIGDPKSAVKALWHTLGRLSDASDAATRIPIYEAVLRETNGDEFEAAFRALEVLNFSRHGAWNIMRYLTKMIPFLNARIQGFDVLYQGVKSGVKYATGNSTSEQDARMGKRVLIRGLMLAAVSLALESLNSDDEDYQQLPNYVKDNNLLIGLGAIGMPGKYFAAPKPFEAGFMFSTIPQHIYHAYRGDGDTRETIKLFTDQFAGTFGVNFMPQAIAPIMENYYNMDSFTGLPIVTAGQMKLDPSLRYNDSTSKISRMIGGVPIWYNTTTGQWEGSTPAFIDNIITGYGGPLGTYFLAATDAVMGNNIGPSQMPYKSITDIPGIRQFLVDAKTKNPKSVTDAYELFGMVDEVNRTLSRLKASGDFEAARQYYADNRDIISRKKQIMKMVERLNNVRAQKRRLERSDLSREEKLAELAKLREVELRITSSVKDMNAQLR